MPWTWRWRWGRLGAAALVVGLLTAEPTMAQTLRLRLNPMTLSFPDASPTTTPVIQGNQTIRVRVRVRNALPTDSWSVNALAGGDLLSGPDLIPIANTSWSVTQGGGPCNCVCQAEPSLRLPRAAPIVLRCRFL